MGRLNRHDILSGAFWLGFSIFLMVKSLGLGVGPFINPAPGFMLFWSCLLCSVLSIFLMAKSLLGKGGRTTLSDSWMGLEWWKPILAVVLLLLYASSVKTIGFLLAMSGLMTLLYALGRVRVSVSIAAAIVTVFLAYVIFHFGLQVPFPRGILSW
jgi:hypothetical protein